MKSISIFGTSSDAGKSTITFALGRVLASMGYKTTPFKAQNVSNNSMVADDGSEIAVSTFFQSFAMNTTSSYHINPILLKSSNGKWQLVVNGKVEKNLKVKEYYDMLDTLKPKVKEAFLYLQDRYDIVIAEGAGSPVELNLLSKDLSNTYIANEFDTKIILVADISKGGVFASIYGVYHLLDEKLRKNIIGVIINKFMGDISFFDEGIDIIQSRFGIPTLGILPYSPFNLAFEDSYSITSYHQDKNHKIKIAVIKYPHFSNFNDIEPLIADDEVLVDFVDTSISLDSYDMVLLGGSKNTISDLRWLKEKKIYDKIKSYSKKIVAICGGYEMLFDNLIDIDGVETTPLDSERGFGFIDDDIRFYDHKILKKGAYELFDDKYYGFEIHCGISQKYPLFYKKDNIEGTFLHSIFDNNTYRTKLFASINDQYIGYDFDIYRQNKIDEFCNMFAKNINIQKIIDNL